MISFFKKRTWIWVMTGLSTQMGRLLSDEEFSNVGDNGCNFMMELS